MTLLLLLAACTGTPAVDDTGALVGAVSGGCIEAAVITAAPHASPGAPAQRLGFGVSDAAAWEVGLACGGKVEVFVEAVT